MLEPVPTETERSVGAEPAAPVPAEDLLLSVARGDQMAFSELYDRLAPGCLGWFGVSCAIMPSPRRSLRRCFSRFGNPLAVLNRIKGEHPPGS